MHLYDNLQEIRQIGDVLVADIFEIHRCVGRVTFTCIRKQSNYLSPRLRFKIWCEFSVDSEWSQKWLGRCSSGSFGKRGKEFVSLSLGRALPEPSLATTEPVEAIAMLYLITKLLESL